MRKALIALALLCSSGKAFVPGTSPLPGSPLRGGARRSTASMVATSEEMKKRLTRIANIGEAIDTLRRDVPATLHAAPDTSIFASDVVLREPSGITTRGLETYTRVMTGVRLLSRVAVADAATDVTAISALDDRVKVRWSSKVKFRWSGSDDVPAFIDGISEYHFDEDGRVSAHRVTQIAGRFDDGIALPKSVAEHIQRAVQRAVAIPPAAAPGGLVGAAPLPSSRALQRGARRRLLQLWRLRSDVLDNALDELEEVIGNIGRGLDRVLDDLFGPPQGRADPRGSLVPVPVRRDEDNGLPPGVSEQGMGQGRDPRYPDPNTASDRW